MAFKTIGCAVVLSLTLAACGGDAGSGTTLPGPGPEDALVRIEWTGGFAPVEMIIGRGPVYTLTAGGRLVSEGPVPAIFPGPLLPNYLITVVTDGEMRQIRNLIERMGLPDMVDEVDDSNTTHVADAHTTVITYWDTRGTHRYSVYALGMGMGTPPPATRVLEEFVGVLDTLAFTRDSIPYQPKRVRVLAAEGTVDPDFADLREWPLPDTDFSDWVDALGLSCKAFDADVLEVFESATQVTTWRSPTPGEGPAELTLIVRGLHPGEGDCPEPIH
jgi:hypothetical protein